MPVSHRAELHAGRFKPNRSRIKTDPIGLVRRLYQAPTREKSRRIFFAQRFRGVSATVQVGAPLERPDSDGFAAALPLLRFPENQSGAQAGHPANAWSVRLSG